MEKKVSDIVDAFENYRFEDCLRQIDQLMKKISKQDNKKKNTGTLNEKQEKIIMITKVGALAATGHIHEANFQIKQYFNEKNIQTISTDQIFLFFSISELCNDERLQIHVQNHIKKANNAAMKIQKFMLNFRMFSGISKLYLKQFVTSKRNQDGFAQIYLEYLAQLSKYENIQKSYKFNSIIKPNKQLNLKMVELFFMKFLNGLKMQQIKNKKLIYSINDLRLRLAIHGQKVEEAIQIYQKQSNNLNDPFTYLRSIRQIYNSDINVQQKKLWDCHKFYLVNTGKIFKKNTSIQEYTPFYDFYDEFLQFLLSKMQQNNTEKNKQIELTLLNEDIKIDDLYNFQTININEYKSCLIHYYESLWTEYKHLINVQSTFKKSDYYKISIKGLLLQMIKIHFRIFTSLSLKQNKVFKHLLKQYFSFFSKTLTYPQEMLDYLQHVNEIIKELSLNQLPKFFQKSDDNLILLINISKISQILQSNQKQNNTIQKVLKKVQENWIKYNKFIVEIQNKKKLEKGQRYLSDEFILLLSDILIKFMEESFGQSTINEEILQILLKKLMVILSQATQVSPYNSDLKLRLLYICNRLNYFDKLVDTFLSMDIKSVQFETLGHYILHPIVYFNIFNQFQNVVTKMVRSYQENQRQTSQYAIKALKAGASNQLFQFFSYQKRLDKSFSKLQLYYTLYLHYKNDTTSKFYLNLIKTILVESQKNNQKLSFNIDIVTMRNTLFRNSNPQNNQENIGLYNQFYGIMSSTQIFRFDIELRIQQHELKQYMSNFINKEYNYNSSLLKLESDLKKISQKQQNVKQLFSLRQFDLLQTFLGKQKSSSQKTINNKNQQLRYHLMKIQIKFYIQVSLVKILAMKLCEKFLNLLLTDEKQIEVKINQTKIQRTSLYQKLKGIQELFQTLSWRMQTKLIGQLRSNLSQITFIFTHFSEELAKHKKILKQIKNLVNETSQQINQTILKLFTEIKFNRKSQISEKFKQILPEFDCKQLQKRDEILERLNKMDMKQAKKLLLK